MIVGHACILAALSLSMPIAFAQALVVETGQETYHYGEHLTVLITVEYLSESFAFMQIRDSEDKKSSPIQIPITGLRTELPSPLPFDREVYPTGRYFVDVTYSGHSVTASFELVDVGNTVVPNWIKQVAFHWMNQDISDGDYLGNIQSMFEQGTTVTQWNSASIPDWVQDVTGWWLSGLINDSTYIMMIQYLITHQVITGIS